MAENNDSTTGEFQEEEFTPAQDAYFRHEIQRGIEQLDRGQYSKFDAEKIIAEQRECRSRRPRSEE